LTVLLIYIVSVHILQECGTRTTHVQKMFSLQEGEVAPASFLLLKRMPR